jgi:hypothetical protein
VLIIEARGLMPSMRQVVPIPDEEAAKIAAEEGVPVNATHIEQAAHRVARVNADNARLFADCLKQYVQLAAARTAESVAALAAAVAEQEADEAFLAQIEAEFMSSRAQGG